MVTCLNCGASHIPNDAKFCPNCGKPLVCPSHIREFIVNGYKFEMIEVTGGHFFMGESNPKTPWGTNNASYPQHPVELSTFYIGKFPVTQRLWHLLMDSVGYKNYFYEEYLFHSEIMDFIKIGDEYPMVYVCYDQIQQFLLALNISTGMKFVLPTEAQWEFAARGGNFSHGYKFSGSNQWNEVGWFYGNSGRNILNSDNWNHKTAMQNGCCLHEVGLKLPNELGIYDMSGNCNEICEDIYVPYSLNDAYNPHSSLPTNKKSILGTQRGGNWRNTPATIMQRGTAFRDKENGRDYETGFRLVLNI